jgi:hypothetical protein
MVPMGMGLILKLLTFLMEVNKPLLVLARGFDWLEDIIIDQGFIVNNNIKKENLITIILFYYKILKKCR